MYQPKAIDTKALSTDREQTGSGEYDLIFIDWSLGEGAGSAKKKLHLRTRSWGTLVLDASAWRWLERKERKRGRSSDRVKVWYFQSSLQADVSSSSSNAQGFLLILEKYIHSTKKKLLQRSNPTALYCSLLPPAKIGFHKIPPTRSTSHHSTPQSEAALWLGQFKSAIRGWHAAS